MNKIRLICSIVFVIFLAGISYAGDPLTLEDAIRIGLENNYNIQIARNTAKISSNNKGLGTANLLPTLDASGSYRFTDSEEESNSASSLESSETKVTGGTISLNWTLFDGFKMFIERKRYNELARQGEYQARATIENNVVAISQAYFYLIQQEMLLDVATNAKEISAERLEKERVSRELGGASSTDFLNAQVAYNADLSSLLNQELEVKKASENLNVILGRGPKTEINILKEITIPALNIDSDKIYELAYKSNSSLMLARQSKRVAEAAAKTAYSPFLPKLSLNASYGYTDYRLSSDIAAFGDDIYTYSKDAVVGLTLSFNIFNGGRDNISLRNARLEARNRRLALKDAENQLIGTVEQTYETFLTQQQLIELEKQNVSAAQRNLDLIQDKYSTGAASSLEFRDAQVSLTRAQTSLISAQFRARMTRIEIEQLIGNIGIE